MSSLLYIPATTHRILYDLLQILGNDEKKPFEIGCRSKSPETQDRLYNILSLIIVGIPDIIVEKKAEDYIVCVKRVELVSGEVVNIED